MTHNSLFTAEDVWKGGHFQLLILPRTDCHEQVCALLKALWSYPLLGGCYLRTDCEPATQARVQPCEIDGNRRLYGLMTLPNGKVIPCGSYAMDYAGEADSPAEYWASLYLPYGCSLYRISSGRVPFWADEQRFRMESSRRFAPRGDCQLGSREVADPIGARRIRGERGGNYSRINSSERDSEGTGRRHSLGRRQRIEVVSGNSALVYETRLLDKYALFVRLWAGAIGVNLCGILF